ncbi:hypothetical protein TWF569_006579 [Orbilia oligospora]|uniref:Uncharacterized protein n=1 Tax=Orbilia oligospora TaxID=2813651 RepID=A0A7C8JIX4_ORBOL|nr:hypothetical protein TWF103_003376 [Orbilia oligospora]KAF3095945.1 hypothetical protein TWF706_007758 [Orbilia oligospora]KAF3105305.1 hypothetical protein TWF102_002236 [Orbilia oligospora]KAF3124707.1 hypothetical protein TWF703_011213 [Orbilia oligospora]KAF3143514.1 hypothetical protein TWF594_005069 [Orbilia oligospora]
MQISIFTIATLIMAPLAAMAAPAAEAAPNPAALPDSELHTLIKRGSCSTNANCSNGQKCNCQYCFGGPIQCYKICC